MKPELVWLAWAVALTFAQMLVAVSGATAQVGLPALAGNREGLPPITGWADGAARAHRNMLESLVLFAALVLIAVVARPTRPRFGAQLFFWGCLAYAVVFIAGIPWLRTAGMDRLSSAWCLFSSSSCNRPHADRHGAHGRAGRALVAQRQDQRAGDPDAVGGHLVELRVLDEVDPGLRQHVVVHCERQAGRCTGAGPALPASIPSATVSTNGVSSPITTMRRCASHCAASYESPGAFV